jgi:CheY-like chemotaxis protein
MADARDLILYVDDEEHAVKYFRLAFAKDYEVVTATCAEDAISIVEREGSRLALVISDQRMPGKSGTELLALVKERLPATMRLLTTAFSDLSSAVDAVNKGWVYAYVHKPWQLDELKVVIRRALEYYHLQLERDALLSEKIATVQELLLADRLRSSGLILAAIGAPALAALPAWWAFRSARLRIAAAQADPRDLWPGILATTRNLAVIGGDLATRLKQVASNPGSHDAAAAIAAGVGGSPAPAKAQVLSCDPAMLTSGVDAAYRLLRSVTHGTVALEFGSADGGFSADLVASGQASPVTDVHAVDVLSLQAWSAIALGGCALADATGADGILRLRITPATAAGDAVAAFIETFDRSSSAS